MNRAFPVNDGILSRESQMRSMTLKRAVACCARLLPIVLFIAVTGMHLLPSAITGLRTRFLSNTLLRLPPARFVTEINGDTIAVRPRAS